MPKPKARRHPRDSRDLRGIITLVVLLGTYGLAFVQLLIGHEDGATIPPWAAQLAGVAITAYSMSIGSAKHARELMKRKPKDRRG